jgi:ATP-binding cassette subfamily B protein
VFDWKRLARVALPERLNIAALFLLALVTVALEAVLPWPLKLIVDHVLVNQPLPGAAARLAELPAGNTPSGLLMWLATAVFAVFLAVQIVKLLQTLLQARVSARLQWSLAARVFEAMQGLSLVFHRRSQKGDLVRRITTDTTCVSNMLTGAVLPFFASTVSLIVLFSIMWRLDATLAIIAGMVALPMMVFMRLLAPRMTDRSYEHQQLEGQVWSVAEQTLTALPLVQAFGRELHEQSRFSSVAALSLRAYLRSILTQIQFKVAIDGSLAAGAMLIMLVGGLQAVNGDISVGTLIVFLSYLTALYTPLLGFAYLAPTIATAAGSARRVAHVLESDERVVERPGAPDLRLKPDVGAHVRLEGIVFGYDGGTPVLQGLDFDARPGETVALVGATGAGKSTLVSLIPRLFDPWQGRVSIDGQDVREASVRSVRAACALVLQDSYLLPGTIAENIAYGRDSADRGQILAAARAAHVHEFVEQLPDGYDTHVGERGATLSAGQKQRIAIARALLQNAPVLIMDEPTSALDVASEEHVMSALGNLIAHRTCIIIAHRLSTVRRADRIVVLERGAIAEMGTHETLMRTGRLYRELHLKQLGRTQVQEVAASNG